ncbi:Splicing factor 3B subunit 2 [Mactra antiquata]
MAATGTELSDLRKLTVVKLKDRLSKLGLSTSGLKADLVERLHSYYDEQSAGDEYGQQDKEESMNTGGHFSPPPHMQQAPPSLMSLPTHEPSKKIQPPPSGHVTRTSLQMRLQQMAGQASADETPSAKQPQAPPQPPSIMTQQLPPPPQMGQPSTQPPPLLSQPVQPPPQMSQPSSQPHPFNQPIQPPPPQPPQMNQPPQMQHGPSGGMPPPQPSQPPQNMIPPPQMGQPPMAPPPHVNQPPHQMGGPPQMGPPGAQMSQSNQPGPPPPQIGQPPSMGQSPQDVDLHEKIAMQTRLLEQERQQQEQHRLREQQQKERMAIQQQAMLLQQQQQGGEEGPDLMEKVRQQQIMLEQQKQKERLEQQQKALLEQQNQAIKKQEEERRRNEAEIIRQQQIALMEAKREEQQKRITHDNRGPPENEQRSSVAPGPNQAFNPRPSSLHGPRSMIPSSSGTRGIPPLLPPQNTNSIPPLLPPSSSGDHMRGPRPQDDRMDRGPHEPKELKLPSALEKVLAFKDVRAQEVGLTPEEIEQLNMPEKKPEEDDDDEIEMVEMEDEDQDDDDTQIIKTDPDKESKNKKRKKKKKKAKKNRALRQQTQKQIVPPVVAEPDVLVEYVQEQLDLDPTDPNYFTFSKIFEAFKIADESKDQPKVIEQQPEKPSEPKAKTRDPDLDDSDDEMDEKMDDDTPKLSKKKLKKLTRLSVAQLKQLVTRPDVVEMHDVTAQDPRLLVHLKATRNTVAVPRHWCFKRKYLQGKRGIEKAPFELPDYIQATGITEMRAALAEKEDQKNLKAKMREKVRPKMGKIDIDYQKLHDAFFRWQTKPKMTIHGDLYYEGKEFETRLKEKKPGNLSDDLKTALGMPIGPQSEKVPPPWLIAMQRYGPPPSYPNLKIPGLNGPIPEGCSFGYHAGGWGKPPVDEGGKPLYGDVFGTKSSDFETAVKEDDIDKAKWGELESESESEEESESESEEETPEDSGLITPAEGLVTPSGITSVPVGMETPDMIELRKRRIEDSMDQGGDTPALYQVIPEKKTNVGGAMMGSAHIYDVPTNLPGGGAKKPGEKVSTEGIEVALNPEELDLDTAAMQAKYDQTLREQQSQLEKEDLSDMVAEHAAKQKKRKKKQEESGKAAKKYKEFKF